jgi:tetratricopeptide (TPR) repeat protein
MKRLMLYLMVMSVGAISQAQPNCNVYLWEGDTAQYNACMLFTENMDDYYQFDKAFHHLIDSALTLCPHFAFAYWEKAAPYVKSGHFLEWKKNIDLAVKYDTLGYLPIRASLRYKFFADYKGAIEDIEILERISPVDIGYTSNGTYHLTIVKALCYKQIGDNNKARTIIENLLQSKEYAVGLFDYLHLGVLYLEWGDVEKALVALHKQAASGDVAEVHYYLALVYRQLGNTEAYQKAKDTAIKMYAREMRMFDQYNYMIDQIFEEDLDKL